MTEMNGQTSRHSRCYACGSSRLVESNGFIVCSECGTCQKQPIMIQGPYTLDHTTSWTGKFNESRQYGSIGKKPHVANALGSSIGNARADIMRASKNLRIQRLQERTILGPHERLLRALVILNRTADQLQLPDQTRDHAAFIVKRILPNYRRGLWVGHLVTAALTLAVRQHRLPVLEADILKFIPLRKYHKTRLNRIKWQVVKSLDIKWPCSQPQWFVPRIISCIRSNSKACEKLSQEDLEYDYFHWLERTAVLILGRVELTNRRGANPAAIAASLVYSIDFKSLHITTQAMVGEAIGFSENSIRDHHRYIWRDRIEAIIKDIGGEMTGE